MPCPAALLVRKSTGCLVWVARRRAVILRGLHGIDAGVVVAGCHENSGILRVAPHVVIGRVGVQRAELIGFFDGSKFRDIERAPLGESSTRNMS